MNFIAEYAIPIETVYEQDEVVEFHHNDLERQSELRRSFQSRGQIIPLQRIHRARLNANFGSVVGTNPMRERPITRSQTRAFEELGSNLMRHDVIPERTPITRSQTQRFRGNVGTNNRTPLVDYIPPSGDGWREESHMRWGRNNSIGGTKRFRFKRSKSLKKKNV
jgi:hypothetical protein